MHNSPSRPPGPRFLAISRSVDGVIVMNYAHKPEGGEQKAGDAVVRSVLSSPGAANYSRLTVTVPDGLQCHYDCVGGLHFCVVTGAAYPQRLAFKLLGELQRKVGEHGLMEAAQKANEAGLNRSVRGVCADLCARFADASAMDTTLSVMREVDEVKGIMGDSINQLLATHDNLEVLEDKTDTLAAQSQAFQRKAVTLRNVMWWRNCKLKIILSLLCLVILAYILVPVIGSTMGMFDGDGDGERQSDDAPDGDSYGDR